MKRNLTSDAAWAGRSLRMSGAITVKRIVPSGAAGFRRAAVGRRRRLLAAIVITAVAVLAAPAIGRAAAAGAALAAAGPPAQLVFLTQPSGGGAGAAFPAQPVVAVEDAAGNQVTTDTSQVTLSITAGTGTAGAGLTCAANPVTAAAGAATFAGCSVDTAGAGYTLQATDGALTAATSASFNVAVPAIIPAGTSYVVNAAPGAQHYDPHVDGNIVAYAAITGGAYEIHYYNLSTGLDTTIPNGGQNDDFLPDINAGRIVLTHVTSSEAAIMLYDTTTSPPTETELDPMAGSIREAPGIGGGNVVWQDFGFYTDGSSDIVVYNLASQTATRLTSDGRMNQAARISPDGNVITWQSCVTFTDCAIYDAVYTAGTWVTNLISSDGNCSGADTNGVVVVYSCARTVNGVTSDGVYFQPAGGGAEQAIDWGGQGDSPSVIGNYISFSGLAPGASNHQIYVAELTDGAAPHWDGKLYQLTDGSYDAQLNDITMNADGSVTDAWSNRDIAVYAFTFTPETAQQRISGLAATITGYGLAHGLTTSLLAKLNAAQADFQAGNTTLVCGDLQALINDANAQSGKGLTPSQASYIATTATNIRQSLGC